MTLQDDHSESSDEPEADERPPVDFDDEKAEQLSRFLALVLRHRAPQFRLDMDDEGFVNIDDLLDVIDERRTSLSWVEPEHIEELASAEGRKRFEVRGDDVRATYGHSFHRPISYPRAEPPEHLYIGVPRAQLSQLRASGITPKDRQYVHLSESREEAEDIGHHHDENAVVVTVRAREAHDAGILFHRPTEGIFLATRVPPRHLDIVAEFGRRGRKRRSR
jgi:putative RNA 2'-phosphotransferase